MVPGEDQIWVGGGGWPPETCSSSLEVEIELVPQAWRPVINGT